MGATCLGLCRIYIRGNGRLRFRMMVPYPAPGTEMGSLVGTQLGTLFKSVPARSFVREGKTTNYPHRPPKLLNRLGVVRQVSHCGKPQRTASSKKPLGFSDSAKLASGPAPLDPLAKAFCLCTPSPTSFRDRRKTSTGCSSLPRQLSKGAALASRQGAYPFGIPVVDLILRKEQSY